jgi:hypothetical protein
VYIIPLFGAYVADTYWGRYKTISISLAITLVGHILLIISAIPSVLDSSHGALVCFIIAMIIMGIGTGGFKSNISPLIAEQYKRTKPFIRTQKDGERVIVDPALTVSRMYMVNLITLTHIRCGFYHSCLFSGSTSLSMPVLSLAKLLWSMPRNTLGSGFHIRCLRSSFCFAQPSCSLVVTATSTRLLRDLSLARP